MEPRVEEMLRDILAQECEARGFSFASQALQNPEKFGETHWTMVALIAMRRAYLLGRDDANADAESSEVLDWTEEDPGTCATCGQPWELVRPGSSTR